MTIPGNVNAANADGQLDYIQTVGCEAEGDELVAAGLIACAEATLALAHEQRLRNRLAAITAAHRGLALPPDLEDLTTETHS